MEFYYPVIIFGIVLIGCGIYKIIIKIRLKAYRRSQRLQQEQERQRLQQPLTQDEIEQLSRGRRNKFIHDNYLFHNYRMRVNKSFKSNMNPNGFFCNIDEPLNTFPSLIANLLKDKKHEWVVYAIADDYRVKGFYTNKGEDNTCVALNIDFSEIYWYCLNKKCNTLLHFHNHPNGVLLPSKQDLENSNVRKKALIDRKINIIDFVCGGGKFDKYFQCFYPEFMPTFAEPRYIADENNINEKMNYRLHIELQRLKKYL